MTKGFYNLTSGILSQSRRLDTVANNMTNLSTSGYKAEQYTDSTFQEVLISRVGNKDKSSPTVIGEESYILAPSQLYVDYSQGSLEETGLTLDFAIEGDGFFAIQTAQGVEYTRSGSFSLDGEGYLCLPAHGRVLGADGQPIYLATDRIRADQAGNLYTAAMWADWVCTPLRTTGSWRKMRAACSVRMGRRRLPPRRSSTGNGWRMPTWTCSRR